jgi:hypothetical protein
MLVLKPVWLAIGLAILSTVGLVTYGLVGLQKQSELRSIGIIIERCKLVSNELAKLLNDVPHTSSARLSLIHGEASSSTISQLWIDQANPMVPPGRVVPVPQTNIPLS